MPSIIITNNKINGIVVWDPVFQDELITFGGVATLLAGTILARDSVSLLLVPFVKGGVTNENGIPKAVLRFELTSTGAGDFPARPILQGRIRVNQLVIDADGDASNVDDKVRDQLRDFGILPQDVAQLNKFDNQ